MKLSRYPEVSLFNGFSWVVGPMNDQARVLGLNADATQVRVEFWSRKGKPREWWPITLPVFRGLALAVAEQTPRPSGIVAAAVDLFGRPVM